MKKTTIFIETKIGSIKQKIRQRIAMRVSVCRRAIKRARIKDQPKEKNTGRRPVQRCKMIMQRAMLLKCIIKTRKNSDRHRGKKKRRNNRTKQEEWA